ncbi:propionyl-CoA synthetase [Pikeienuella piscinae]|uniref:Propionyl-CoA synthetase n=1 Tax=Pikeienuella piscinae TaxID=2748098 RepID=A0A7L5BUU3_9RHOB|nr:AMP-binding protein [Pikeienuella piscinae]QIE54813.1 propionyl-CoA synthetase [Pikeienuella piscinae]
MEYRAVYESWRADPESFWMAAAGDIDWVTQPTRALSDEKAPLYEWFVDGVMNTCWNAVDRHVAAGRGDQAAIIHDSPVTGAKRVVTYAELQELTARLGGALARKGVGPGDRVMIYMPMVAEAAVAMLACARIGAVHSVVFGGFASNELAVRIDDCKPKAVIAASCGVEPGRVVDYKPLLDGAIEQAEHKPGFTVILQRPQRPATLIEGRDKEWEAFQEGASPAPCAPVGGADPLYILYTSGTTGQPKGVVRPAGGHAVALNWSMKNLYGVDTGDVFWAASDVGWVVGHSYIVYGPLFRGCTSILYEGKPVGTPDAGAFWRVIAEHGVKSFFTAPTAFRAIKREDPEGELAGAYDLSGLDYLFLAGERSDSDTVNWAQERLGVPVVDHWWQTETGWAITGLPVGLDPDLEVRVGSTGLAMPGYDVRILDEGGHEAAPGTLGAVAVKLPLPPGCLPTLWNAEARFRNAYLETFPGYYETGDAGMKDAEGYLHIMARTDDVINVAGHRLSTGAMEEVLSDHPDVAECAVIGVADDLKGQVPMGFLCLNRGVERPHEEIIAECVALIRERIGPVAAFRLAVIVERLPKTRSGKILRAIMGKIADGESFRSPATIDDMAILDEIRDSLAKIGFPR